MAALDRDKFNDIRQKYKRRVHEYKFIFKLIEKIFFFSVATDASLVPEMSTEEKEVAGPLVNYDVVDEFVEKMLIESDGEEWDEDDDEQKEAEDKKKKDVLQESSEAGTSKGKVGEKNVLAKDAKPLKKATKYADEW